MITILLNQMTKSIPIYYEQNRKDKFAKENVSFKLLIYSFNI